MCVRAVFVIIYIFVYMGQCENHRLPIIKQMEYNIIRAQSFPRSKWVLAVCISSPSLQSHIVEDVLGKSEPQNCSCTLFPSILFSRMCAKSAISAIMCTVMEIVYFLCCAALSDFFAGRRPARKAFPFKREPWPGVEPPKCPTRPRNIKSTQFPGGRAPTNCPLCRP